MSVIVDGCFFFFFRQKTSYDMRISDWSSDVCSSDLLSCCLLAYFVKMVTFCDATEMLHIRPIYASMTNAEADELQRMSPAARVPVVNTSNPPSTRPSSAPSTRRASKSSPPMPRTATDQTILSRYDAPASLARTYVSHFTRGWPHGLP